MSDLIAISFDTRDEAQAARREFMAMAQEHLVELEDAVIAFKSADGQIHLDQTVNLTAASAASGGLWGLLLGFIFAIPTGGAGAALPVISAGLGAGLGALSGKLSDYGIDDDMMRRMAKTVHDGQATLFVLVRKMTADKAIAHLRTFNGTVLRTSLSDRLEADLKIALSGGQHAA